MENSDLSEMRDEVVDEEEEESDEDDFEDSLECDCCPELRGFALKAVSSSPAHSLDSSSGLPVNFDISAVYCHACDGVLQPLGPATQDIGVQVDSFSSEPGLTITTAVVLSGFILAVLCMLVASIFM